MDSMDRTIIEELLKNARISKSNLARKLNLTEAAVRKRLRKLEASGIILGYRAVIDYQKAGLVASITGVDVEPEKLWRVIEQLKTLDEIKTIMLTSGDHTMLVEIVVKGMDKLEEAHRRVENFEGVVKVCPAVLIRGIK